MAQAMPTMPTPTTVTLFLLPTGSSFITWLISFSLVDIWDRIKKWWMSTYSPYEEWNSLYCVITTEKRVSVNEPWKFPLFMTPKHKFYQPQLPVLYFQVWYSHYVYFHIWFPDSICSWAPLQVSIATTAWENSSGCIHAAQTIPSWRHSHTRTTI